MSAFVTVVPMPARTAVVCPDCGIDQEYDAYREALDACRLHNVFEHPKAIQWAK